MPELLSRLHRQEEPEPSHASSVRQETTVPVSVLQVHGQMETGRGETRVEDAPGQTRSRERASEIEA